MRVHFHKFILILYLIAYKDEELKITKSRNVVLQAPENFIPLYIRGGTIIPTQKPANNTMFRYSFSGDSLEYLRSKIRAFNWSGFDFPTFLSLLDERVLNCLTFFSKGIHGKMVLGRAGFAFL